MKTKQHVKDSRSYQRAKVGQLGLAEYTHLFAPYQNGNWYPGVDSIHHGRFGRAANWPNNTWVLKHAGCPQVVRGDFLLRWFPLFRWVYWSHMTSKRYRSLYTQFSTIQRYSDLDDWNTVTMEFLEENTILEQYNVIFWTLPFVLSASTYLWPIAKHFWLVSFFWVQYIIATDKVQPATAR